MNGKVQLCNGLEFTMPRVPRLRRGDGKSVNGTIGHGIQRAKSGATQVVEAGCDLDGGPVARDAQKPVQDLPFLHEKAVGRAGSL